MASRSKNATPLEKIETRAGRLDGPRVRLNTVDKAAALARALTHLR